MIPHRHDRDWSWLALAVLFTAAFGVLVWYYTGCVVVQDGAALIAIQPGRGGPPVAGDFRPAASAPVSDDDRGLTNVDRLIEGYR